LSTIDLRAGITYLIFILIFVIIGIKITSKYFEHKRIELISVGLSWLFVSSMAWDNLYYFIHVLFFGEPSELTFTFIIHTFRLGPPLAILFWMYSFNKLISVKKKNQIIIISIYILNQIVAIIMYIFALIVDFSDILGAAEEALFIVIYYQYITIFSIFFVISLLITGILIVRDSLRSGDPKAKIKAKFLLSAFIISTVSSTILQISLVTSGQGGVYDQYHLAPSIAIIFVLTQFFVAISGVLFYFGFFLPEWLYKLSKKSD
ncbi:MAG: hypothetical protein ACFFAO_07320, partial [Candidatus Hermodarchaeota archaeon]